MDDQSALIHSKARRRRRNLVVIRWFFGVAFGLVLASVVVENWRGRSRLQRILQHLESAGASLDLRRAFERPVAESENGAPALAAIAGKLAEFRLPVAMPPRPMVVDAPGLARSCINADGWKDASGNAYYWHQVEGVRAEVKALMTALTAAANYPRFVTPFDLSKGVVDMQLTSLPTMPQIMRVCQAEAMLALHAGEHAAAVNAVTVLLNLYCNKAEDPIVIAQLVRWSQSRSAFGLTWELFQHGELDDRQWRALQQSWERCEFVRDCALAWEAELPAITDVYSRLAESASYREHLMDNFGKVEKDLQLSWKPPARGWALDHIVTPMWRLLWVDQNHAEALEQAAVEWNLARFVQTNSWVTTQAESVRLGREVRSSLNFAWPDPSGEELNYYDRCRYLFAAGPSVLMGSHTKRAMEAQTEAVMAATSIALKRYHLKHGRYPGALGELIPDFMAGAANDPMAQQPFRYHRTEQDGFRLYSVGGNGVDDGGSNVAAEVQGLPRGGLWSGLDAIWPTKIE